MVGTTMLKYLYKSILVSILCSSLMMTNITAFADSTSATANMSSTGYTRGADGVLVKEETKHFKGTGKEEDSALEIVMMLAVGLVGARLLTYEKWTTDMAVVAGASAIYIIAEIANVADAKKKLNDQDVKVTTRADGKIDESQIKILEDLKESYNTVLEATKKRQSLQRAAATVYWASMAAAIYMRLTTEGLLKSCQVAIAEADVELKACVKNQSAIAAGTGGFAEKAAEEAASCALCGGQILDLQTGIGTNDAQTQALPQMSIQKARQVLPDDMNLKFKTNAVCTGVIAAGIKAKTIPGACTTYINKKGFDQSYKDVVIEKTSQSFYDDKNLIINFITKTKNNDSVLRASLKRALDLILPSAEAGWGNMLGLGTGAAIALAAAESSMVKAIDDMIFTPGGRIIAWGLMAATAETMIAETGKEITKIQDQMDVIDQTIKDMNTLKKGIVASNVRNQQINLAAVKAQEDLSIALNSDASVKTNCIASMGTENCKPLLGTLRGMPGFSDLPGSLQTIASQSVGIADGVSGVNTISSSTITSATQIGNNQGAVKKLAMDLQEKLNKQLEKNGKKKIDLEKQEKILNDRMIAATASALKKNGMSGGTLLASMGINPLKNAEDAMAKLKGLKGITAAKTPAVAAPAPEKKSEFNLKLEEESTVALSGSEASHAKKEELYEMNLKDIAGEKGESIFKIISNRYMRSGYPILLEEIPAKK